ncbi:MAG TPA: peptidylprolyl isomerase [Caulobacteraceae bacterium]|jgi:peptidylprolyl isomerase|nr:peptidylprolyl isomerase [Caulobacteraceae bacterium]
MPKIQMLMAALAAAALAQPAQARPRPAPPGELLLKAPTSEPVPAESDYRTPDPQNVLVIDTNKGRIIVEMTPLVAPASVERIKTLTRQHFYDGQSFFRVIDGFMDQTGDPQNTGVGGSTLPSLPAEFTFRRGSDAPFVVSETEEGSEAGYIGAFPAISQALQLAQITADHRVRAYGAFCAGVMGMARAAAPDSGNSQFFLMRGDKRDLDAQYTAWGRVIAGQDVVDAIKTGEPVVAPQDRMISVSILADMPAASRPSVRVVDAASPWFRAKVARSIAEKVVGWTPCDVSFPSQVR